MNETTVPNDSRQPVCKDEPGIQRSRCGGFALCVGNGQLNQATGGEVAGALNCMHDQQAVMHPGKPPRKYIIRRLTPVECARLQGFPDWWCDGAEGSDSAQYKLWGNGIALPCAVDVLGRIAEEMRKPNDTGD